MKKFPMKELLAVRWNKQRIVKMYLKHESGFVRYLISKRRTNK